METRIHCTLLGFYNQKKPSLPQLKKNIIISNRLAKTANCDSNVKISNIICTRLSTNV